MLSQDRGLLLFCKLLMGLLRSIYSDLWFTWKGKDGYGDDGGYLQIKVFYCLSTKENGNSTGKTRGKHKEFGINSSVATLLDAF